MKKTIYILQMLFVLMLAVPQLANANEREDVLKSPLNYSVIPKGNGTFTIKVPVYLGSKVGNYWATNSSIIQVVVDGVTYELLNYQGGNYDNDANSTNEVKIRFDRYNRNLGVCSFTNANQSVVELTSGSSNWQPITQKMTTDITGKDYNTTYLEFDWTGDYNLFNNKEIAFKVKATYDHKWGSTFTHTIDLPKYRYNSLLTPPTIAGAYLNTEAEKGEEGQVKVIGYSTTTPKKIEVYVNEKFYTKDETLEGNSIEFVIEPCDTARTVQIVATYLENGLTTVLRSKPYAIAPYHKIKDFKLLEMHENTPKLSTGYKKLFWSIDTISQSDMFEADYFSIERAYLPDMSDAVKIGSVALSDSVSGGQYEFLDESDAAVVNPETGGKIYYRVSRSTALALFPSTANKFIAADSIENMVAYQPKVSDINFTLDPEYEFNRKIDIAIDFNLYPWTASENQKGAANYNYYKAIWNKEARVMLYIDKKDFGGKSLGTDSMEISTRDLQFDSAAGAYKLHKEYSLEEPGIYYYFKAKVVKPENGNYIHFVGTLVGGKDYDIGKTTNAISYTDISPVRNITATEGTEYGFVRVSWELPGNRLDRLVVLRRAKGTTSTGEVVAEIDPQNKYYEDHTALLNTEYEYGVRAEVAYYGAKSFKTSWDETDYEPAYGWVSPTGKITGKVVTIQGAGIGGQTVNLTQGTKTLKEVTTKDDGTFEIEDIPLQSSSSIYTVQVPSQQLEFTYNGDKAGAQVSLNGKNSLYENVKFVCSTVERFSGRVLFENSTIPVTGAMLRINGETVHGTNGAPVKTDNNGNFEIYVPKHQVTVQVYKPGHRFVNDGFVLSKDKDEKSFTPSSAYDGLIIYDQTKVLLRGRVIGGNTLAAKPLGQGLTQNNLGDSITLQLKLEGNNTANIVYLKDQPDKDSLVIYNEQQWKGQTVTRTRAEFFRKQIDIHVDNATGEYALEMFPTKYKITQAFAQGYASLFANGEVAQVLDLTDSVATDSTQMKIATHSITYHSDVDITYEQLLWGVSPVAHLGADKLKGKNLFAESFNTTLAYIDENDSVKYLLDAPLFISGEQYFLRGTAHEDYYYNNVANGAHYVEPIHNGKVYVQNGFAGADPQTEEYQLDTNGQFTVKFVANNNNFALSGEDARRQFNSSVAVNGFYYQSKPIKAYVTGTRTKPGEVFTAKNADIRLLDILRDPPGATSYSYYGSGKQYEMSRKFNLSASADLDIDIEKGASYNQIAGTVAGQGTAILAATSTSGGTGWKTSINIPFLSGGVNRNATYNFTSNEVIKTSDDPADVGAMADVYIGTTSDVICTTNQVIMIIDEKTYNARKESIEAGLIKVIQEGKQADGTKRYLVTAEELQPGITYPSVFTYSQSHIITKVIPQLLTERNNLLIGGKGVTKDQVQALAKKQKKILYYYKGDDYSDVALGKYGVDYEPCFPSEASKKVYTDEIAGYNKQIIKWMDLIATNELLKVKAINDPNGEKNNHSVSAGQNISYSEQISYNDSGYNWAGSFLGFNSGNFGSNFTSLLTKTINSGIKGSGGKNFEGNQDDSASAKAATKFVNDLKKLYANDAVRNGAQTTQLATPTIKLEFKIVPDIDIDYTNKSEGFPLATCESGYEMKLNDDSYMNVSIYKTPADSVPGYKKLEGAHDWVTDGNDHSECLHQYVFVVNGGATRNPWCDADSTLFYRPGTPLGVRTQKIDNPTMTLSATEISNIPEDEKATFMLKLTNDSELTGNQQTTHKSDFTLTLVDESNDKGAKLSIDGMPLTDGRTFSIAPGESLNKTLEVMRGDGYDFNNLKLQLACKNDDNNASTATFSVHFLPSSSPIKISAPNDKWVMNTFSSKDTVGYYMPIVVEGYNTNYNNFDHIEIQYKKSTEGDANWVNLCSYYVDDQLYEAASGTKSKEQIATGKITHAFYGEKDPIEMKYDIRAVTFCRLGTGYVTKASNVITGIKDTRRPMVFGQSQPLNGILTNENSIMLPFSEQIAYNYLDETSNFDIRGYLNSDDIDSNVGLVFSGDSLQDARTTVSRNLSNRDFTVDLHVLPEEDMKEYTFFQHGNINDGEFFVFGITDTRQLFVNCNGSIIKSVPLKEAVNQGLMHVGVVYALNKNDEKIQSKEPIHFFVGNSFIDNVEDCDTLRKVYNGNGLIHFGVCKLPSIYTAPFKGRMLEARLWNQALDLDLISEYNKKMLDGYTNRITGYWPMRQTSGSATDYVNGADLALEAVNWHTASGHSLLIDHKSLELNGPLFQRSANFDYTLSFWMNLHEAGNNATLFAAGDDELTEQGHGKLRIGFEDGDFVVRTNGNAIELCDAEEAQDALLDKKWHHFAMSVSHSRNLANFYIDGNLYEQVQGDKVDGISMNDVRLGSDSIKANIDLLTFWHQALPQDYLNEIKGYRLTGDEMGLYVYMPLDESVESSQGTLSNRFSVANLAKDNMDIYHKPIVLSLNEQTDIDNTNNAPVLDNMPLAKLKYSWSSDGTNLLINLDMKDSEINNRNIFITVRNVEDLNGNTMANPYSWVIYTDRNILRWNDDTKIVKIKQNDTATGEAAWKNITSVSTNYYLVSSSPYIKINDEMGMAAPNRTNYLTYTIEQGMTPGEYDEYIWLVDEDNDMISTLTLSITVEAEAPKWAVDRTKFDQTMTVMASVEKRINGHSIIDTDTRNIVGAFAGSECVGVSNISHNDELALLYLNIYGSRNIEGKELTFYLWDYSAGTITQLIPEKAVKFKANDRIGMPSDKPLRLISSESTMQNISLNKGWNWIALNVKPINPSSANTVFIDNRVFSDGDKIKDDSQHSEFSISKNKWLANQINFSYQKVYHVYVHQPINVSIAGTSLSEEDYKTHITNGWNEFPYLLSFSQPINRAMADFQKDDKASEGDIIKGYNSFAVLSNDYGWIGSLLTLEPNNGYYLFHTGEDFDITVNSNPANGSRSRAFEPSGNDQALNAELQLPSAGQSENNMIIIATLAEGENLPEGATVEAYDGDKLIGQTAPITLPDGTSRYFITVPQTNAPVEFIVRDAYDETYRVGSLPYDGLTCIGSLTSPHILSTKKLTDDSETLYDLSGKRVNGTNNVRSIYIKNGQKIIKQ